MSKVKVKFLLYKNMYVNIAVLHTPQVTTASGSLWCALYANVNLKPLLSDLIDITKLMEMSILLKQ